MRRGRPSRTAKPPNTATTSWACWPATKTGAYTYDADDLVTLGNAQGDTRYQYDTRYQLTEARYPSGDGRTAEAYAYDGVGNRLDQQATAAELDPSRWRYNARNQLVSRNGIGYRYDKDGHLIEQGVLQADGTLVQGTASPYWTYGYDSRGRLVEVRKNETVLVAYRYDPKGRRISKTLLEQGLTTFYLYNQQGLAAEYTATGELIQEYGYDPTAAWMSQPLFTRAKRKDTNAWTVSYFGTSHLGTPEVAFDKRGTLTWQASAQAFGSTRVSRSLIDNPLRFPGQYWDAETGLHYNYFRDYDPQTGRYAQRDPIGLKGGLNSFSYVLNNPVKYTDIFGLFYPSTKTPAGIAAMAAAEGAINTAGVASVAATSSKPNRSSEEERQAQSEHDWYKTQCEMRAPPTGDPCKDLLNEMNRFLQCAYLMSQWDERWEPNRHYLDILQMKENYRRAKERYDKICKPDCE